MPTPLTEGVLANPAFRQAVLEATPLGRLGTPEEVAAAVAFLVGPEAGWISGRLPAAGRRLQRGLVLPRRWGPPAPPPR